MLQTIEITGINDRITEIVEEINELQETLRGLKNVEQTCSDIVEKAAAELGTRRRTIMSKAEDDIIDIMDSLNLPETPPNTMAYIFEQIQRESEEY